MKRKKLLQDLKLTLLLLRIVRYGADIIEEILEGLM